MLRSWQLVIWQLLTGPQLVALLLQVRPLLAGSQFVTLLRVETLLIVRPQLLVALLQGAALDVHLAADELRRERLPRERTVALRFLRRNLQRDCGETLR